MTPIPRFGPDSLEQQPELLQKAYARDGLLLLEDFIDHKDCDALKAQAQKLVAAFDPQSHSSIFSTRDPKQARDDYFLSSGHDIRFFFEADAFGEDGKLTRPPEQSLNKIGHAMHDLDPVFSAFSRQEKLKKLAGLIGFKNPLLLQSMYIFKQPHIGGEVTCHQDATFLWTEPQTVVGFWFALEEATLENGCLCAIAGGHKAEKPRARFLRQQENNSLFLRQQENNSLFLRQQENNSLSAKENPAKPLSETASTILLDPRPFDLDQQQPLEVKKGSLILLHGLLPHLSGPNHSSRSRHAYTLHLIEAGAHYPNDNWLRRPHSLPLKGF